jgi:hypothetical protein
LFFIAEWNSHDWKIFILIGVSMNHAHFIDWKRKSRSGLRTENFEYKYIIFFLFPKNMK